MDMRLFYRAFLRIFAVAFGSGLFFMMFDPSPMLMFFIVLFYATMAALLILKGIWRLPQ